MSDTRNVVLVCGGRDFRDQSAVFDVLGALHKEKLIGCIVQGGASGADFLAKLWARVVGVRFVDYPADWEKHGKAAGPRRNEFMLHDAKPNLVVAFPGGRGTAHMVNLAKKVGVNVIEISPSHPSEKPAVKDGESPPRQYLK
jgi:hypothetical protein